MKSEIKGNQKNLEINALVPFIPSTTNECVVHI